jgi:hypothetical protein
MKHVCRKFFCHSDYSNLPARIGVRELRGRSKTMTDDLLTADHSFGWRRLTISICNARLRLQRGGECRQRVTEHVLRYWTQNPDLRVIQPGSDQRRPEEAPLLKN